MDLIKKLTSQYTQEELEAIERMANIRIIEQKLKLSKGIDIATTRGSIIDLDDDIDRKVEKY